MKVQDIGGKLQKYPLLYSAAAAGLKAQGLVRRPEQIKRYFFYNDPRKLKLGAGSHVEDGWLCTDLIPVRPEIVFLDVTKTFPFDSNTFTYIQTEHIIEHLPYEQAEFMLKECHRVLHPGGVIRVSTPDLDNFISLLNYRSAVFSFSVEEEEYIAWSNEKFHAPYNDAIFVFNRMVREWGHKFLYDQTTLKKALTRCGFKDSQLCSPNDSTHPGLKNIDRHTDEIGEAANEFESLIVEGMK